MTAAWIRDAAEKIGIIFAFAFVGALISAGFNLDHLSAVHGAINAGIGAGLGAVYTLLGSLRGGTTSPAGLVPAPRVPAKARKRRDAGHVDVVAVIATAALVLVLLVIFGVLTG